MFAPSSVCSERNTYFSAGFNMRLLSLPVTRYLGVASSYQPIVDELNHSPGGSPRGQATRVRGGRNRQRLACSDLPFLGPRQRELCALDKSLIHVISDGASMGIEECQHQFQDRRWNCSTFNTTSVFGNILNIRE